MSAHAAQASPHDDPGPQPGDARGHGQALDDLIGMGLSIARHLNAQADAQAAQPVQPVTVPAPQTADAQPAPVPVPAPPPAPDALIRTAASFDQIARAVRRCIALAHSLDAPKQQPASHPAQHEAPDRTAARTRILRAVEDNIQRPPDNPECDDAEVLLSDFRERMDAPDLDDDIRSRPVEDIIRDILRDLGLAALPGSRPWMRRTPADVAELNARAAAPSRPARDAARQHGPNPQDGQPAAQPAPNPTDQPESGQSDPGQSKPGQSKPVHPSAAARPPVRPGHTLPEDPAEAVAFVLHHTDPANARRRPPPED